MTPQGLEKLWRRNRGKIPHLHPSQFEAVYSLANRLHQPSAEYWGIVDQRLRHEGNSLVHCFNFGNTSVKYPWQAEAVNFGLRLPMNITRAGTIRTQRSYRSLLHQVDSPFLVFGFDHGTLAEEQLQSGFVLTEPGTAEMVRSCEMVMAPGFEAPEQGGVLFYFLTKRLSFTCDAMDPMTFRGSESDFARVRVQLSEAMLLEPGWILLMLERDRWMWGVVSAVAAEG